MKMDEVGSPTTTNLSESMELVQDNNQNMSPKKKTIGGNAEDIKGKIFWKIVIRFHDHLETHPWN